LTGTTERIAEIYKLKEMDWHFNEFTICTDRARLDISFIHTFLSKSYWAAGMPRQVVEDSIRGSECFGLYRGERQIGFARVITDKATFAYLADVFIDEKFRGQGLSKWMMEIIRSHPELQGLRRWLLATRDAHGLYEQFGFRPLENPERFMQINDLQIYTRLSS